MIHTRFLWFHGKIRGQTETTLILLLDSLSFRFRNQNDEYFFDDYCKKLVGGDQVFKGHFLLVNSLGRPMVALLIHGV
jgi:hypothetical protein